MGPSGLHMRTGSAKLNNPVRKKSGDKTANMDVQQELDQTKVIGGLKKKQEALP